MCGWTVVAAGGAIVALANTDPGRVLGVTLAVLVPAFLLGLAGLLIRNKSRREIAADLETTLWLVSGWIAALTVIALCLGGLLTLIWLVKRIW